MFTGYSFTCCLFMSLWDVKFTFLNLLKSLLCTHIFWFGNKNSQIYSDHEN